MSATTTKVRNPRRVALEILRNIRRNLGAMVADWNQAGSVFERITEPNGRGGEFVNYVPRPRRDDERIENDPAEWARLVRFMDQVIHDAEAVRTHAVEQYHAAKERQQSA
jgi:hypothetical protein